MERLTSKEPATERNESLRARHQVNDEILLLDDDLASLRVIQGVLRAAGYVCRSTHHPEQAIALVAAERNIRIVISDICMPDMSGLMFLERLNALEVEWPLPRVLFLTGHPTLETAVAALRLGAVDFLTKPLKPSALLEAVHRACDAGRRVAIPAEDEKQVADLVEHTEALLSRLRMLTRQPPAQAPTPALPPVNTGAPPASGANASMTAVLDTIEKLRRLRNTYYSTLGQLDEIDWELLVEVLRAERTGRRISVSGLSISVSEVSSTTALRRINDLVSQGHLLRIPDPSDARRDFVTLSATTSEALQDYVSKAGDYLVHSGRSAGASVG
jgi:CheY-like chemotaxis protein